MPLPRKASSIATSPVVLELSAKPDGAKAFVNGGLRPLPTRISGLPGEKLTVAIEKDGYETETVELVFGARDDSRLVELRPKAEPKRKKPGDSPRRKTLLPEPTLKP